MFMNIGYKQYANVGKIALIASFDSLPVKRDIQNARQKGTLVDATKGKRTLSVIYTGEYIILSAVMPERLSKRTERMRAGGNSNNS